MARYACSTRTSFQTYPSIGALQTSDAILDECFINASQPEDKSNVLRLKSRNQWLRNDFTGAFNNTITALRVLGVDVCVSPSRKQADVMFEQVKNEILAVGFDEILSIPRTADRKTELAVTLLNDAGQFLYPYHRISLISFRHQCLLEPLSVHSPGRNWSDGELSQLLLGQVRGLIQNP